MTPKPLSRVQPLSCLSSPRAVIEIFCILLSVLEPGPMGSEPQARCTGCAPSQPRVSRKYVERLWGHRKKLSFRLATVLSLSLGPCYQSHCMLFEATTSCAWKTPLPLSGGGSLGPLFSKPPRKDFLPSQLQVNRFCSVSPVSLASLLSQGEHSEDSQGLGGRH